jgi:formate hydrogenlyase subunit 4
VTISPVFRAGAWIVCAASVLAALIAPIAGPIAPLSFDHDFVVFAYAAALARLFLVLSALDVGSAFEAMGASREASFATFAEPALFLLVGAAAIATGQTSFAGLVGHWHQASAFPWLAAPAAAVLFVMLQAEASRLPVDDPLTHLELTMVHEAMILDHSGPELAAMQYASALKLTTYAGLIAALLNPVDPLAAPAACLLAALAIMAGVAVAVGCVESLVARRRMDRVPAYLLQATVGAALCLGAAGWFAGTP